MLAAVVAFSGSGSLFQFCRGENGKLYLHVWFEPGDGKQTRSDHFRALIVVIAVVLFITETC